VKTIVTSSILTHTRVSISPLSMLTCNYYQLVNDTMSQLRIS